MQRLLTTSASLVLGLLLLSGCGASVVTQADLEKGVTDELTELVGTAPDDVTCPGDLDAEVGTTMRCTLTAGEDELGVTVTVTEVDGSDIAYDIEVDDA